MMSRDDCAVRVQWFSSVKIIGRDRERTAAMHADCRRLVAEKDDGKILKIGRQGTDSRPSAVTVLSLKESPGLECLTTTTRSICTFKARVQGVDHVYDHWSKLLFYL